MNKKFLRACLLGSMVLLTPIKSFAWSNASETIPIGSHGFIFNQNHSTVKAKGYDKYKEADGSPKQYIKDYYGGQFPIYMPYKSGDLKPWENMTKYLKENNQTSLGRGGAHLVPGYLNIKKGAANPHIKSEEGYMGDGSGNFWIAPLKLNGEFRYQGYLKDATLVDNPYFPDDVYGSIQPEDKNWYLISAVTWTDFAPTSFNKLTNKINGGITYAQQTFEMWFANTDIGAKFKAKTPQAYKGKEWQYWNQRLQIQGDVTEGSVIITGWHQTASGRRYYQSFPVPSRPANNITITKLEIIDKETGKVLENYYRTFDINDPMNVSKMKVTKTNGESVLEKGKEYRIEGEIYYTGLKDPMKDAKTLSSRTLATVPPFMDMNFAYDAKVDQYNSFDKEVDLNADESGGLNTRSILPGTTVPFVIDNYKVPDNVKKKGKVQFTVPLDYVENGDNSIKTDDYSVVAYKIGNNDLGMKKPVDLTQGGKSVDFVTPGAQHEVTFTVEHVIGKTAIGLDPTNNPMTTIDVNIRDLDGNLISSVTKKATEVLQPGGSIKITVPNISTSSMGIEACAIINKVHADKGLNSDPTNDRTCQTFVSAKNYAIKDLKITPHLIQFPQGSSSKSENLTFTFTVANEGKGGTNTPLVVIKQGGTILKSYRPMVPSGAEVMQSLTIPTTIRTGENLFSVEVNPAPREVVEVRPDNLPPYEDNIKTDKVIGKPYVKCVDCTNQRTSNTWSEKFKWVETKGKWKTREYCDGGYDSDGNHEHCYHTETYCDTWVSRRWEEVKDYNEQYKITNIYFRSKWSKDTKGGDGWVDLLNGGTAKIKAGYGFEFKVLVNYKTNRNNLPSPEPVPWQECSYGLTRNPGAPSVYAPSLLYVEMPFSSNGNKVCYIMDNTTNSGSWYNRTQTFELPERSSFNIKNERKVYTNETARPGNYKMSVRTAVWDGYNPITPVDTSNKKPMQDCKDVWIEILPQDDLKSHIVQ